MKQLVEFPLEDGTSILIEIEESIQNGLVNVSRSDNLVLRASQTLEKSLEKVKPAAQHMIKKIREIHETPDEVQISFGLKLNAEAGAVIASGGMEANYVVTLKWANEKKTKKTLSKKK